MLNREQVLDSHIRVGDYYVDAIIVLYVDGVARIVSFHSTTAKTHRTLKCTGLTLAPHEVRRTRLFFAVYIWLTPSSLSRLTGFL